MLFEYNSSKLITGGQDRLVKMWDANTGSLSSTLHGCLGSVLDLTITHDNQSVIAASSSNNLYAWDVNSGWVCHTLTGHTDKVCAVDVNEISSRHVVSAAYDCTIKVWDLVKGYCTNIIIFHQQLQCSFPSAWIVRPYFWDMLMVGNLRLWDIQWKVT